VDGAARPPTLRMTGSLRPSARDDARLAVHTATERRHAALFLWWMALMAADVGAPFDAAEWRVLASPAQLQ